MQDAYLDYAMSVIVSRALPDVRDGLKPVHRRILYAMHQLGLTSKAKYRKSATVVGEVLGRYHPHGDIAVYDSLVRMAQDFAMRYPLIDGQGNFGSIDGDSPAAMRYTEVKMKTLSEELLFDIEKETIPFMDNYDGTTKEPVVLPSKLPNFLLGGTMGIAVGMATNVPPHNLSEVLDASMALIDNPELTTEDLLDYIKGPDFPTGGIIYDFKEIKEAYSTGKGRIVMRGVAEVNSSPSIQGERQQIIISEIPYNVNKADLVAKIADLVKNRKIEGVADLRDESDRDGIRVVIDLKRDAFAQKILNGLYKHTQLQETFHLNMLALVDGLLPRVLTLKVALEEWLKHRNNVVRKRCEFELKKAKERAHILEGLKKALDHLEEVIETIKKSKDRDNARNNLIKKFSLDVLQADAILDMRLAALAALERQRIIDELKEKLVLMAYLEDILAHPAKILGLIKEELKELKAKYGDERRTKVIKGAVGTFSDSDLIPNEEVIVTLTTSNYIKRTPVAIYHSQGRGGKGVIGMEINKEDGIRHLEATYNLDNILFFTNLGRVFQTKVYDIPVASRIAKGTALVNLIPLGPSEKVTSIVTIKEDQAGYLFMATKKGIVKKTSLSDYKSVRKNGLITIRLDIGDELCWVRVTGGEDDILLATEKGLGIRFRETNVRSMGRATRGVIGIRMKNEDMVVGMDIARKDNYILTVSEKGLGKRTPVRLFKTQTRGGMGVIAQRVNEKTGKIVAAHMTSDDVKDIILVSKTGQIIRIPYRRISSLGRATQGIRLMRLNVNDRVASVVYILKDMQEIEEKLNHKETLKPKKSKTIKTKSRSIAKTKVIKSNVKKKRIRTKPKKGITKPKIKEKSHIKVHTYEVVSKKADKLETNETKKSITKTITPNVKVHHYV
ncbi:MAG: DNA gyrase subunit A, partial [Candidatus Berkelbacteria bacterium]|nr:DNA gyrase subunit A [Candidatus Berkelbacteria bacterium]